LYRKESTDAILSVNTIYFMDDLESLFKLWLNTLKPGGKLVLGFRPAAVMQQFPFSAYGFRLYDENEVRCALLSAGFHKVEEQLFEDEPREVEGRMVPVSGCCWVYQR
jgi:SAM-dependent methyltransferase